MNLTFQATAMLGLKTPWHLVGVQPRQYSSQGSVLSGSNFKIQSTIQTEFRVFVGSWFIAFDILKSVLPSKHFRFCT